jgi:hypothetical protein
VSLERLKNAMKNIALRKLIKICINWIGLAMENRSLSHLYELQVGKEASIKPF